jgi:hypothetical protein
LKFTGAAGAQFNLSMVDLLLSKRSLHVYHFFLRLCHSPAINTGNMTHACFSVLGQLPGAVAKGINNRQYGQQPGNAPLQSMCVFLAILSDFWRLFAASP